MKIIRSLEGVRGLAAVFVALFHFGVAAQYMSVIKYGYLFVDLFFVLSGFVIQGAYSTRIRNTWEIRPFIIRRFGRLFPLMIFATLLYVVATNVGIFAKREAVGMGYVSLFKNVDALNYMVPRLDEVASTLALAQGLGFYDRLILNYASWSISVEFYTYIVFAVLCVMLQKKWRMVAFGVLSIAGLVVTAWSSLVLHDCVQQNACNGATFDFGFTRCIGSFFLGSIAYECRNFAQPRAGAIQVAAAVAVIMFFILISSEPLIAFCFPFLSVLLVLSIQGDSGFLAKVFQCRLFQMLGQRSFSIYMLHPVVLVVLFPVQGMIKSISSPTLGVAMSASAILLYLVILAALSKLTYEHLEIPTRDWFNGLTVEARTKAS